MLHSITELEIQAALSGAIRQGLYATAEPKAASIKNNLRNTFCFGTFRQSLPHYTSLLRLVFTFHIGA
jgi:hypothetical protein